MYSPCPLQESVISGKRKKSDGHIASGGPSMLLMALACPGHCSHHSCPGTFRPAPLKTTEGAGEMAQWVKLSSVSQNPYDGRRINSPKLSSNLKSTVVCMCVHTQR